jgi:hypothetical protein
MDNLLWASTPAALSCVGKTSRTTPSRRTSTTTTRWAWARWPGSSASGSAAPCCCRRRHGCAGCPAGRPSRRRRVSGWHLSVTKFSGILILFFHIFWSFLYYLINMVIGTKMRYGVTGIGRNMVVLPYCPFLNWPKKSDNFSDLF